MSSLFADDANALMTPPLLRRSPATMQIGGVAAGMEGILLRKHNNVRILVALDSIAQAFVIEIDGALVKPVGGKLACAASAFQIQEHQGDA